MGKQLDFSKLLLWKLLLSLSSLSDANNASFYANWKRTFEYDQYANTVVLGSQKGGEKLPTKKLSTEMTTKMEKKISELNERRRRIKTRQTKEARETELQKAEQKHYQNLNLMEGTDKSNENNKQGVLSWLTNRRGKNKATIIQNYKDNEQNNKNRLMQSFKDHPGFKDASPVKKKETHDHKKEYDAKVLKTLKDDANEKSKKLKKDHYKKHPETKLKMDAVHAHTEVAKHHIKAAASKATHHLKSAHKSARNSIHGSGADFQENQNESNNLIYLEKAIDEATGSPSDDEMFNGEKYSTYSSQKGIYIFLRNKIKYIK